MQDQQNVAFIVLSKIKLAHPPLPSSPSQHFHPGSLKHACLRWLVILSNKRWQTLPISFPYSELISPAHRAVTFYFHQANIDCFLLGCCLKISLSLVSRAHTYSCSTNADQWPNGEEMLQAGLQCKNSSSATVQAREPSPHSQGHKGIFSTPLGPPGTQTLGSACSCTSNMLSVKKKKNPTE